MSNEINEKETKPLGARLGEAFFCVIYLVFMVIVVAHMAGKTKGMTPMLGETPDYYRYAFGFLMGALLVGGDAFHLIPRIIIDIRGSMWKENVFLGAGSLISSITMTLFYNILIAMGDSMEYSPDEYNYGIEKAILVLTLIRIILLLFPQNKWYTKEPARKWAIIRNVPFVMIGILVVCGLFNVMKHAIHYPESFYLTIIIFVILSFAFYLPVAILGKEKPKLGMLMIPKTICYMIMMGVIAYGNY